MMKAEAITGGTRQIGRDDAPIRSRRGSGQWSKEVKFTRAIMAASKAANGKMRQGDHDGAWPSQWRGGNAIKAEAYVEAKQESR